ncbi:alpha/beta fold hydrolase [Zhongshania sp.]|uniref:alpha/beta fold hydrolase n=1 Tax=Zhongshania sp. TaxID=1971902 RepID=UPI00356161B4
MDNEYEHGKQITLGRDRLFLKIEQGDDDLPPLLICNGLATELSILDAIVKSLQGSTVIRFDPPGIGGSKSRLTPYHITCLARTIITMLDRLGHAQVDVFGISWGGTLAQELALRFPDRIRRVILAATTMGIAVVPGIPGLRALTRHPLSCIRLNMVGLYTGVLYGGDLRRRDAKVGRYLRFMQVDPLSYCWQALALSGWTSIHRLHRLKHPVLIMAGRDDPIIPLINARIMRAIIPKANLQTYDCGHLFPFTRTELVAKNITAFRST